MTQRADGEAPNRAAVNPELPTANKAKRWKNASWTAPPGKRRGSESATEQTAAEAAERPIAKTPVITMTKNARKTASASAVAAVGRRGGRRRNRNTAEQTEMAIQKKANRGRDG